MAELLLDCRAACAVSVKGVPKPGICFRAIIFRGMIFE